MVWKNVKNRYERDGRMNPLLLPSQESMTIIAEEQPVKQFAKLFFCAFCGVVLASPWEMRCILNWATL